MGNLDGQFLWLRPEETDRFPYTHIQNVINVLSLVEYLKDVGFESLSTASLADHCDISHELHRDPHEAISLTLRASATFLVEREERRRVTVDLGILLVGKQLADVIIDLEVSHRVGTGTLTYRILVDIFNPGDPVEVAGKFSEHTRKVSGLVDPAVKSRIKNVPDKGGLPGAADSGDDREYAEWEFDIDILKVMLHRPFHID